MVAVFISNQQLQCEQKWHWGQKRFSEAMWMFVEVQEYIQPEKCI